MTDKNQPVPDLPERNLQVQLASRPIGWAKESDFRIVSVPVLQPEEGQFLVRSQFLSLDPYMRGRMNAGKSYAPAVELGDVMVGAAAGEVVASRNPQFPVGDKVVGRFGWQLYATSDGAGVTRISDQRLPLSVYLGAAGMPGLTAYIGLYDICAPKPGETVVVTAASGAVGSVVGQLARIRGCRAVGIAGGDAKCRHVVEDLGFDACVDYKSGDLLGQLERATPDGVDVCFENVGGEIFDRVVRRLNPFARIALCGLISQYNEIEHYGMKNIYSLLVNRVRLQGFIIGDHQARWPQATRDLTQWLVEGKIRYRETIADGLENAPAAFIGMLSGRNLGKQLVRLG